MHVGQTGTMFLPDIAQCTDIIRCIEPTGRLIDTDCMELGYSWIFFRVIGITADDTAAVTSNAYDTAMFPMYTFFFV